MYHLDVFFTHSSVLAWRIPGTAGPGGLLSMGLHRVGHNWSDLAAAAADIFFTKYSEHFLLNRMFHLNELVWLLMGLFFLIMRSFWIKNWAVIYWATVHWSWDRDKRPLCDLSYFKAQTEVPYVLFSHLHFNRVH